MRLARWHWSWAGPSLAPGQWYGALLVVLATVSKVDVRARDPQLALAGSVDTQILVEVSVWALAGVWVAHRLAGDRWFFHVFPRHVGLSLRAYAVISVLIVLSAVVSGSSLSIVRAGQLGVLIGLGLLVQRDVQAGRTKLVTVATAAAATLVVLVLGLMAVGAAVPELAPMFANRFGQTRYGLLETHPIGSGQLLGLALLGCASGIFLPARTRVRLQVLLCAVALVLAAGLWETKARGALAATAIALLLLLVLARRTRARDVTLLGLVAAAAPVVGGRFDAAFEETLVRGQTVEELSSLSGRTELFRHAWELVSEQPVIGHGYLAARGLYLERFPWAGESHNALVDIAISLGLLGVVLYVALLAGTARRLLRHVGVAAPANRNQTVVGLVLLVWLLVDGIVSDSFGGPVGPSVAVLLLTILLADDAARLTQLRVPLIPQPTQGAPTRPSP